MAVSFDCTKHIVLENNTAQLRPLERSDLEHLKPFSVNEPELWTYSLISGAGINNLKEYVKIALTARDEETSYPFIVFDKRKKTYAGSTRFYDIQRHHRTIQLGFTWYGKEFQRTGLNTNCKYLLLQFAFETVGFERVEFRADYRNKRSIAAMKSIGCTEEGVLRSNCASPTGRRDSIVLSIVKNEWYNHIESELRAKAYNQS